MGMEITILFIVFIAALALMLVMLIESARIGSGLSTCSIRGCPVRDNCTCETDLRKRMGTPNKADAEAAMERRR